MPTSRPPGRISAKKHAARYELQPLPADDPVLCDDHRIEQVLTPPPTRELETTRLFALNDPFSEHPQASISLHPAFSR